MVDREPKQGCLPLPNNSESEKDKQHVRTVTQRKQGGYNLHVGSTPLEELYLWIMNIPHFGVAFFWAILKRSAVRILR